MAASRLWLVLSLLASCSAQDNFADWRSLLVMNADQRGKAIEEMTKRTAVLLNQRADALRLVQTTTTFPVPVTSSVLGIPIEKRPTVEDDLVFLRKMKEQAEVYEGVAQSGQDPEFLTSIPAPPYIPYKPLPFYFVPNPNLMSCESLCSPSSTDTSEQMDQKQSVDYLEKRRKNNDSARKSREVRRVREQAAKKRMEELQEENRQLMEEIGLLRMEYSQLLILFLTKTSSSSPTE